MSLIPYPLANPSNQDSSQYHAQIAAQGSCGRCEQQHFISEGKARDYCHYLMDRLRQEERIDLSCQTQDADPQLSCRPLFGEARGQMFGVLIFQGEDGVKGAIPAFSGQFNGRWQVTGWAPPLLDPAEFQRVSYDIDKEIKEIGRQMAAIAEKSEKWYQLRRDRKRLSQNLMQDIHALYKIENFRGEQKSIFEIFQGKGGIPSGTGDCCAPKLLNYAARHKLTPLGLAEFYWGRENPSKTKQHGEFYPSCQAKCAPILGFMLCGLKARSKGQGVNG